MTGEKLRSVRREHRPCKAGGGLLGPGDEEAAPGGGGGGFTAGRAKAARAGGRRASGPQALKAPPVAGGGGGGGGGPGAEPGRGPAHFPVHECVFKGDVRRLSALIRTQGIGQKDSHGEWGTRGLCREPRAAPRVRREALPRHRPCSVPRGASMEKWGYFAKFCSILGMAVLRGHLGVTPLAVGGVIFRFPPRLKKKNKQQLTT